MKEGDKIYRANTHVQSADLIHNNLCWLVILFLGHTCELKIWITKKLDEESVKFTERGILLFLSDEAGFVTVSKAERWRRRGLKRSQKKNSLSLKAEPPIFFCRTQNLDGENVNKSVDLCPWQEDVVDINQMHFGKLLDV